LIILAYGITPRQIGVLDPIMYEKYDVQASADHSVPRAEMLRMLQSLLAERFKLRIRRETRELPIYALVINKGGPRLQSNQEQLPWNLTRAEGNEQHRGRVNHLTFENESMPDFAAVLSTLLAVGRFVVDKTGLSGIYDFELNFTPSDLPGPSTDSDAPSVFTAIQEQLGLRLEPQRAPVEFLVIEHVERPDEN
jgi:uncharacterized protein (TIGR03435 family)